MLQLTRTKFFISSNHLSLARRLMSNSSSSTSTVIEDKLKIYNQLADNWWDTGPKGSMKHLHTLEPLRTKFVCDQLRLKGSIGSSHVKPLKGLKIIDVGCGVGITTESLALLGAEVTGIDPSSETIKVAKKHAASRQSDFDSLEYLPLTAEELVTSAKGLYDVAIVYFILENIQNRRLFLNNCLQLLKPNGSLFVLHVNRTLQIYLSFYIWHQYFNRSNPRTYLKGQYKNTLKTSELLDILEKENNCQLFGRTGIRFKSMRNSWYTTNSEKYFNFLHIIKKSN